jgi:hypothetical protein
VTQYGDKGAVHLSASWGRIIARIVLGIAMSACTETTRPVTATTPEAPAKNIRVTDWYNCHRLVSESQWTCEYMYSTEVNIGGWVDFLDPAIYTSLVQVTTTTDPCSSCAREPAPQAYAPLADLDDDAETEGPDCNVEYNDSNDRKARMRAYCASPAVMTPLEKQRVNAALSKIAALGPPCDTLANLVSQIMSVGHMRVWTPIPSVPYLGGGWAPLGKGADGTILIHTKWIEYWNKPDQFQNRTTRINSTGRDTVIKTSLPFMLAHEADHLLNSAHHIDSGQWLTPLSVRCGGS